MYNLTRQNRFISAVLLGSLITLSSGPSFAADGSDHLKFNTASADTSKPEQLAENGSERLLQRQQRNTSQNPARLAEGGSERSRVFWLKHNIDVAEGGADRVLSSHKA